VVETEIRDYVGTLYAAAMGDERRGDAEKLLRDAFDNRRTAVVHLGSYLSFDVRVKADLYSEHCSVAIMLDNPQKSFTESFCPTLAEAISLLRSEIEKRHPDWSRDASPDELVHSLVWRAFDKDFGAKISQFIGGKVFGDFRGFSVCADRDLDMATAGDPPAQERLSNAFRMTPPDVRLAETPKDVFRYIEDNRPFFYACLGLSEMGTSRTYSQPDVRWESNNIFCEMLGGGALYGSTLGNPRAAGAEADPIPIKFFVVYNGLSAYQLGRLVRRIHTLAELRLAALFDRSAILELTSEIRKIGEKISKLIEEATASPAKNIDILVLEEIIHRYNRLGVNCVGGLLYRVNRSNYYFDAFMNRLQDLRQRPIEGWQSYEGFVRRNFGHTYRAIESIGDRYKQAGGLIDRSLTLYHAQRQHVLSSASTVAVFFFGWVSLSLAFIDRLGWHWDRSIGLALVVVLLILVMFFSYMKFRYAPRRVIAAFKSHWRRNPAGPRAKPVGQAAR
jgi:hypothetical protein